MNNKREWYSQMDGLRFFAVCLVLVEHFAYQISKHFHAGFFGVELFFVISGFLITEGLLHDKNSGKGIKLSLVRFFKRRSLRILPIYFLTLVLSFLLTDYFNQIAIWAFTYTINYYPAVTGNEVPEIFGHLWSLSVEEQFYLFWPFLILLVSAIKLKYILTAILIGSLLYFIISNDYWGLGGRIYSLCSGAILALLKMHQPIRFKSHVAMKFGVGLTAAIVVFFFNQSIGLSILAIGLVYLCTTNSYKGIFRRVLEQRFIAYGGRISYGIYLYHVPLAYFVTLYLFDPVWNQIDFDQMGVSLLQYHPWIVKLPLYTALSLALAHFSFSFIEKPILELKRKI